MQYARYGKPTGTSYAAIKKAMKGSRAPIANFGTFKSQAYSLNKAELKYFDTTTSAAPIDSTLEVFGAGSLVNTTQGDSNTNREGATILVKSLQYNVDTLYSPGATNTGSTFYLWLVQDRQPNGATPAITDVFTSSNASLAMPNVANQHRFKILRKHAVVINPGAGVNGAYNQPALQFSGYVKFKKPLQVRYTGNAGTVADVTTNNIFIACGAVNSDDLMVMNSVFRIRFTG